MRVIIFLSIFFFLLSGPVHAARDWTFEGVYVEDVLVYYKDGQNVVTVLMSGDAFANTGCSPTDTHHIVSHWKDVVINGTIQTWVSVLLSAQAQNLPVDLMVDMSTCSTGGQWDTFGNPAGLGLRLFGVRISKK